MNTTSPVSTTAKGQAPAPAIMPTPAEHHNVAAVFRPCTLNPSRKMMPAPRKPIPDTTCAATRVGLTSFGTSCEKITKLAAPNATSALVRSPAMR